MKRRLKSLILSLAMIMILSPLSQAQGSKIQIKTNGQRKNVAQAKVEVNGFNLYCAYKPYVDGSRTFVPIRELTELMGADVKWHQKSKSVSIRLSGQDVKLKIDSPVVYVDGKKTKMDQASVPRLTEYTAQNGACKTMVPLRFLSESLGFEVKWDQSQRLASISNGMVKAPEKPVETGDEKAPKQTKQVAPKPAAKVDGEKVNAKVALPEEEKTPQETPNPKASKTTVVLDAGHGGGDSGAVGVDGTLEKTLALKLAKRVEGQLKQEGYEVIMTRDKDEFIKLYDRSGMANKANADIFLSMHFNSAGSSKAYGIEVLYASENDVSRKKSAGDQTRLANEVLKAVLKETGANNRGIKNRPDLAVLRTTDMSAALVEGGFMSNPGEMSKIKSDAYLDKLAQGIVTGIKNYDKKYL